MADEATEPGCSRAQPADCTASGATPVAQRQDLLSQGAWPPQDPPSSLQPLSAKKPVSRSQLRQHLQLQSTCGASVSALPALACVATLSEPTRDATRITRGQRLLRHARQGWQSQCEKAWANAASPQPVHGTPRLAPHVLAFTAAADAAQMQLDEPSNSGVEGNATQGSMHHQRRPSQPALVQEGQVATVQQLLDTQPLPRQKALMDCSAPAMPSHGCLDSPPPPEQAVRDVLRQVRVQLAVGTLWKKLAHLMLRMLATWIRWAASLAR